VVDGGREGEIQDRINFKKVNRGGVFAARTVVQGVRKLRWNGDRPSFDLTFTKGNKRTRVTKLMESRRGQVRESFGKKFRKLTGEKRRDCFFYGCSNDGGGRGGGAMGGWLI